MPVGEIVLERIGPNPYVDDDLSETMLSRSTMALRHEKYVHYLGLIFANQETPMVQGRRWFKAWAWSLSWRNDMSGPDETKRKDTHRREDESNEGLGVPSTFLLGEYPLLHIWHVVAIQSDLNTGRMGENHKFHSQSKRVCFVSGRKILRGDTFGVTEHTDECLSGTLSDTKSRCVWVSIIVDWKVDACWEKPEVIRPELYFQ
ncbi:hypothetical protein EDD85DRAFT_783019 [Armillaria nabsnona]|nr:hypothetical protein EDD85DRAFT_783019 [Armillaria nabsnona]